MEAICKHPSPKSRQDVINILSDQTGDQYRVYQEIKQDDYVKTIATGTFLYSLLIFPANSSTCARVRVSVYLRYTYSNTNKTVCYSICARQVFSIVSKERGPFIRTNQILRSQFW